MTGSTVATENAYAYNNQNRLTDITTKVNNVITMVTGYTYDKNGNKLTTVVKTYTGGAVTSTVTTEANTYDGHNQVMKTVTEDGTIVNNIYNAEGYRTGKEVNGEKTYYLYEADKIILEVDGAGNQKARNVYGTNLIRRTVEGKTYYYMYNGHADVTALITGDGTIAATYYYDAFGNILESTGDVDNNIRYSGYQYDEETGMYYLNSRMYDPKTARFLQEDTYTGDPNDPLSLNLYTYCSNNPIIYWDPTGHINIKNWFNDYKKDWIEGWKTLTNKDKRDEAIDLMSTGGDSGLDANLTRTLLYAGSLFDEPQTYMGEYNQDYTKPFIKNTLKMNEKSTAYKGLKYVGIRAEAAFSTGINLIKGSAGIVKAGEQLRDTIVADLAYASIEAGHALKIGDLADAQIYNYAKTKSLNDMQAEGDKWAAVGKAIQTDFKTTLNAENAYNFMYNPDMSLEDTSNYMQSTVNSVLVVYGGTKLAQYGMKSARAWKEKSSSVMDIRKRGSQADFYVGPKGTTAKSLDEYDWYTSNMGNPVEVAGYGNTGRNLPNNLTEQMAMYQVQSNPLQNATQLPFKLGDTRWLDSEGWVKMQSIVENSNGKTVIHYVYNTKTGAFDDFKFK